MLYDGWYAWVICWLECCVDEQTCYEELEASGAWESCKRSGQRISGIRRGVELKGFKP